MTNDEIQHEISLVLRSTGTRLTNYDEYTITLDMFAPGSPWAFSLWRSGETESAWRRMLDEVRLGDTVIIAIDGATQVTGRIEQRVLGVDHQGGAKLTISGRDMAGPAIDWDADPRTRLVKQNLIDTLTAVFRPLGIPVIIGANADAAREVQSRVNRRGHRGSTAPAVTSSGRRHRKHTRKRVDFSHAKPGERIWQVAESIVRKLGYMMWIAPAPNGELAIIIDTPNYEQLATYFLTRRLEDQMHVTLGSDILESSLETTIKDVPTVVYAFGKAARGDNKPSRHVSGISRRSIFARPLRDDSGFWVRSGLPNGFDPPESLAYEGPRIGAAPEPAEAANVIDAFTTAADAALDASSQSQPTAARTPILTRHGYENTTLSERFRELVMSPLPPQPRFLHSKKAHNPDTAEQEAKRVIAFAMRKFREYKCTVRHHGQIVNGELKLFAMNTIAEVYDRVSEIGQENMLITKIVFSGSRQKGQHTELTLGTANMVMLTPDDGSF